MPSSMKHNVDNKTSNHVLNTYFLILGFSGASRPSSISTINFGSFCEHLYSVQHKTITKKVCFNNIFGAFLDLVKFKKFGTHIFVN